MHLLHVQSGWALVPCDGAAAELPFREQSRNPKPACAQPLHPGFLTGPEFKILHEVLTQPLNTNKAKLKLQLKADGIRSEILAVFAIKDCIRNCIRRFALTAANFNITPPITNINGFIFKI